MLRRGAPAATLAFVVAAGCLGGAASSPGFFPEDAGAGAGGAPLWRPVLLAGLGDPESSGLPRWTPRFDATPKAYDIDGDGVDEIIAQANDTNVYVFRARTGVVLAVLPTVHPPAWHIERVLNGVEAGVLRPGESPSLVITDHAAYVASWRYNAAASSADHFSFDRQFNVRVDGCHANPSMDAKAVLADLDGDGALEIVVQTEEIGFYALRANGSVLWRQCWGGGNSAPVVADLDGDGHVEVVVGSDQGLLSVLAGSVGRPIWTFDAAAHAITPGSIVVSPTVAELDGKPPMEVLFTARHAPKGQPFADNHMAIFAVHQDPVTYKSALVWMRQPSWANPLSNTRLAVLDVDNDGGPDIFGMDWNTIGHYPGDWERLGPAHLFRLDADGNDVWVREVDTWWSNQDIAVGDVDGEGEYSILANGPAGQYDGLWRFSAATGVAQAFLPLSGWKVVRGPQLVDLDHDGTGQLIFPVAPLEDGKPRGAILVFDLGAAFDAPWTGAA